MLGIPMVYLPPTMGALIWLALCFQLVLGLRWIKLGRIHFKVHRWLGIGIVIAVPIHALWATSVFLGWPFRIF